MKFLASLLVDARDFAYWSSIFAMAGAASLAVAFFEFSIAALVFGIIFCIIGLQFNRKANP